MALRPSNRKRNAWAVELLDVRPSDRVLEIGFGPGIAVREIARRATHGQVAGIDRSEVMHAHAARRNATAIRAGRVSLTVASIDDRPALGSFDKILVVNNFGMWSEPIHRLEELASRLRGGGSIAIVTQPRCPGATSATTATATTQIIDAFKAAGLVPIRVETLALKPPVACIIATVDSTVHDQLTAQP
jgi:SAM-dependent methyltransferase